MIDRIAIGIATRVLQVIIVLIILVSLYRPRVRSVKRIRSFWADLKSFWSDVQYCNKNWAKRDG